MRKKICVVTGGRAEYGLLYPLLQKIKAKKSFDLSVVATGMHLEKAFGLTYREIEKDGFKIREKVSLRLVDDSPAGILRSMGLALAGFGEALKRIKPDLVLVLGDRFEIFCAATAAHVSRIPLVHIHGGESTEGAFDDAFRHAITKMSIIHFTSAKKYRNRVIQLGEDPRRVFNVGALGLDNIKQLPLLDKKKVEDKFRFKFKKHNLLVTYHPVTLENDRQGKGFAELLKVLDRRPDTLLIFTKANADTNGRVINRMIDDYVNRNADKAVAFAALGRVGYLSTMKYVEAVVGNSSSGIIEASSFKIGTINIGDRQKGRIQADSVINCGTTAAEITDAFRKLYSPEFQKKLNAVRSPYGDGKTADRMVQVLESIPLKGLLKKSFHDLR